MGFDFGSKVRLSNCIFQFVKLSPRFYAFCRRVNKNVIFSRNMMSVSRLAAPSLARSTSRSLLFSSSSRPLSTAAAWRNKIKEDNEGRKSTIKVCDSIFIYSTYKRSGLFLIFPDPCYALRLSMRFYIKSLSLTSAASIPFLVLLLVNSVLKIFVFLGIQQLSVGSQHTPDKFDRWVLANYTDGKYKSVADVPGKVRPGEMDRVWHSSHL
jgi:hypothetical protein